jgi:hypothetical protein
MVNIPSRDLNEGNPSSNLAFPRAKKALSTLGEYGK